MKKFSTITQWIFTAIFGICALGTGFHLSSLFLLLSAILMMPIPTIRNIFNKCKLKNSLIIILSVVIFIVGIMISPPADYNDSNQDSTPPHTDNTSENGEISIPGSSGNTNNQNGETSGGSNSNNSTNIGGTTNNNSNNNDSETSGDNGGSGDNGNSGNNSGSSDNGTSGDNSGSSDNGTSGDNGGSGDNGTSGDNSGSGDNDDNSGNTSSKPEDKIPDSVGKGTPQPVDPTKIPVYSGSPYIVIESI